MAVIKAGTVLTIEHGEYSDKGWDGPYTALKDFDQAEVTEQVKAAFKPKYEFDGPSSSDFSAALVALGLIEDLPSRSWYVGSYSLEPDIWPNE